MAYIIGVLLSAPNNHQLTQKQQRFTPTSTDSTRKRQCLYPTPMLLDAGRKYSFYHEDKKSNTYYLNDIKASMLSKVLAWRGVDNIWRHYQYRVYYNINLKNNDSVNIVFNEMYQTTSYRPLPYYKDIYISFSFTGKNGKRQEISLDLIKDFTMLSTDTVPYKLSNFCYE